MEPLVVFDVHEEPLRELLGTPFHMRLLHWFEHERIDPPRDIYRFEVYLVDCPSARVYEFARDASGHRYLVGDPENEEIAKREPYEVILSSLPPTEET